MSLSDFGPIEAQDRTFFQLRTRLFVAWFIIVLLCLGTWLVDHTASLLLMMASLGLILLGTILHLYHRTQVESFQHYRQIEALMALYALIHPRQPLPPMRLWAASPDFALLVAQTILHTRPKRILELGSGSSTLISAYCLEQIGSGKITSIDHEIEFASKTSDTLRNHALDEFVTIVHAPLTPLELDRENWRWYTVDALHGISEIDLLIVDGPPEAVGSLARYPALSVLFDRLAQNAVILVDDAYRADERQMVMRWLAEFDIHLDSTIANEKGAIILRNGERKKRGN